MLENLFPNNPEACEKIELLFQQSMPAKTKRQKLTEILLSQDTAPESESVNMSTSSQSLTSLELPGISSQVQDFIYLIFPHFEFIILGKQYDGN